MALPENIDTTYDDDLTDPSVKTHQEHHDEIHEKVNRIPETGTIANQTYVDNAVAALDYTDVGAAADGHTHTGYSTTGHTHTGFSTTGHTHTESEISDLSHYTTANANTDIDARVTKAFVDALNVDADTLDGIDSTGFATSGHTHTEFGVVTHNDQSGTTYTLSQSDAGKVVRCTNAAAVTVTIPTGLTVGTIINVYSAGAGGVTIDGAVGVTIRNNASALTQYEEVSLRVDGTDEIVRAG